MKGSESNFLKGKNKLCMDIKLKFDGENIIYSVKHKLLGKIELNYWNYLYHIMRKHKEAKMDKIFDTLNNPDFIYKHSRNDKKNHYFEKAYGKKVFRVVIVKEEKERIIKTAYNCDERNKKDYINKKVYCMYDRELVTAIRKSYKRNNKSPKKILKNEII